MRKFLMTFMLVGLMMVAAIPAFAHATGPCADSDGDGQPSGAEYARHHIVAMAHEGALGNGGHKPGAHRGFSFCK